MRGASSIASFSAEIHEAASSLLPAAKDTNTQSPLRKRIGAMAARSQTLCHEEAFELPSARGVIRLVRLDFRSPENWYDLCGHMRAQEFGSPTSVPARTMPFPFNRLSVARLS